MRFEGSTLKVLATRVRAGETLLRLVIGGLRAETP
jgi:hypothetical protein